MKCIRWFLWSLWYLPQPQPKMFKAYMRRSLRTFKPWWKFKPYVSHNPDGEFWEVWLSNESTVHRRVTLTLDCQVTRDNRIVGVQLQESQLVTDG